MPYISADVSKKLDKNQIDSLKSAFGQDITAIPGKTENYLMVRVTDDQEMRFAGSDDDCAMVSVELLGQCSKDACESLTDKICKSIENITGISGKRTYVKFRFVDIWGYNGFLF